MDINVDLGEGGVHDQAFMAYVTSCNIACGGHAGDVETLRQVIEWACAEGVSIGAHPSYPDTENFGRRSLKMSPDALKTSLIEQLTRFDEVVASMDAHWHHIKPHGALYNDLVHSDSLGTLFLDVLDHLRFKGVIYALAGSSWVARLRDANFKVWEEGFLDRRYADDGTLLARKHPDALLQSTEAVVGQFLDIQKGYVTTLSGGQRSLSCQTLCLHSDTPQALERAERINRIKAL